MFKVHLISQLLFEHTVSTDFPIYTKYIKEYNMLQIM